MPFSNRLEGFLNQAKTKVESRVQQYQQSKNQPSPDYASHPSSQSQGPGLGSSNYSSSPSSYNRPAPPPPAPKFYWRPAFNPQTPVSEHWKHQTGDHGWGNNESQNYTDSPQNSFYTPDGKLVIRGIVNSHAPQGQKYTSARLTSHQTLGRQRGYLEVKHTPPCAEGIWPAFWLLPREPFTWPSDGEIDIFESWNADYINRSCLHWGHFNGEDWNKHRALETKMPHMGSPEGHVFGFAWQQPDTCQGGKLVWYIDSRAVMKATIPHGARPINDWQIIINVAMGGNVCRGSLPGDGTYDFVIHSLKLCDEPVGGWPRFEQDWASAPEGNTM